MELVVINHRRAPSRIHVSHAPFKVVDEKGVEKEVPAAECITTVKLKPGANLLTGKLAEALDRARQTIPVVQQMFEREELEIKEPVKATKKYTRGQYIKDLAELTLLDALTAVTDCKEVKTLRRWLHQDARKEVQRAIFARKEDISPSVKDDPKPDAQ